MWDLGCGMWDAVAGMWDVGCCGWDVVAGMQDVLHVYVFMTFCWNCKGSVKIIKCQWLE